MLDFREFKKIKDEKDHAILKHPKGHEIKIAKAALSGKLRKQLDALPHYAGGTDQPIGSDAEQAVYNSAAQSDPNGPQAGFQSAYVPPVPDTFKAAHNVFQQFGDLTPTERTQLTDFPQQQPPTALPQDVYGYGKELSTSQQALSGERQALKREGNLAAEQGEKESSVASNQAWGQQNAMEDFQKRSADLDQERQNFMQDIANTHIDPHKYLGDMSTAGKVSTAIGLILGGIGGGLTHQENPALKFLNAQIDRDIASQRDNLATKGTLLRANFEKFHNLQQATDMTRVMMNDMASAELKSQAAKYGGQIDQQKANLALNQLNFDTAQRMQQLKMQAFITSGAQQGNEIPDAIDPNLSSSFRLNGVKHYAADPEAAKKARDESAALEGLTQSVKDINSFNKRNGAVGGPAGINLGLPTELKGQADALNSVAASKLAQIESMGGAGIGRLIGHFKEGMPVAGSTYQAEQRGKSRGVDSLIQEGHNSILNSYGTRGPNLFMKQGKK
jgi:hypothetical protein